MPNEPRPQARSKHSQEAQIMTTAIERGATTSGASNGSPQGQQLQEAATGLMEQAARTADAQASTTMTRVGETLETIAGHIREAGQELRADQPQIAGLIETAAERVDSAATYLRDSDASEAIDSRAAGTRGGRQGQGALILALPRDAAGQPAASPRLSRAAARRLAVAPPPARRATAGQPAG
jgi:hypothetical protein